jgi:hypothetical protein
MACSLERPSGQHVIGINIADLSHQLNKNRAAVGGAPFALTTVLLRALRMRKVNDFPFMAHLILLRTLRWPEEGLSQYALVLDC